MATKTKQKPKNRKKAYKPKKDQSTISQIREIYNSKGVQGLEAHFSKFQKMKSYKLDMRWNLFDVDSTINLYAAMNEIELLPEQPVPLNLLQSVYKGDLIIALNEKLIYGDQKYSIEIQGKARDRNNPDEEIILPLYKQSFDPAIEYEVFLMGEAAGKYYFKRDGVFTTTWKGITPEWEIYLEGLYPGEDYELIDAYATMTCTTTFVSWAEEREFLKIKAMRGVRQFV